MLSITSTVRPLNTSLADAMRHADATSTSNIAEPVQTSVQTVASAPIIVAVADDPDVWKLLRERLDVLMNLSDVFAQVCYVSTYPKFHPHYPSHALRTPLISIWHGE